MRGTRTRYSMRWAVHSSGNLSTNATQCVCGKNFQVRGETQLKHLRTFLRILSKSLFWQSFDVLSLNYRSKVIFRYFYFCFAGYDTEYTETDRKDIQNLAQEIETKYTQYGKHLVTLCLALLLTILELRKDVEYEADDTLPTCCLAMCLDWCLDKICCREVEEDMVYMPAVRSSIWGSDTRVKTFNQQWRRWACRYISSLFSVLLIYFTINFWMFQLTETA